MRARVIVAITDTAMIAIALATAMTIGTTIEIATETKIEIVTTIATPHDRPAGVQARRPAGATATFRQDR